MLDGVQTQGFPAGALGAGVEILTPASREEWLALRTETIGASELSALFGAHPHMTAFELFATKTGQYQRQFAGIEIKADAIHLPPTERGNVFEPVAIDLARKLRPTWRIFSNAIPGGRLFVDRAARMSCTPDAFIIAPDRPGVGALQIKSVERSVFQRDWKVSDDLIEPPLYVGVQAIDDASLSGCDWACAGAIVAGFDISFYLFDVPLHAGLMAKGRELVADFWRRVEANEPFPPDYARDGELIARIYADGDKSAIDLTAHNRIGFLCQEKLAWSRRRTSCERALEVVDAEIVDILKQAEAAIHPEFNITRRVQKTGGYTVPPGKTRVLRVTRKSKSTEDETA